MGVRTVGIVAVDPLMSNGQRIHNLIGSLSPEEALREFVRGLNYAAGRIEYQVDPDGVFYVSSVPYRPVLNVFSPYEEDVSQPMVLVGGDEFRDLRAQGRGWPYQSAQYTGGLSKLLDPAWLGARLVDDINDHFIDILIWYSPGALLDEGRYNGTAESYMLAAPGDTGAYPLNGGLWRIDGLQRRAMIVVCNMTRGMAELEHSWGHATRDNGVLGEIWRAPNYNPQWTHSIADIVSPLDLFLTFDTPNPLYTRGISGEAMVGTVHFMPNSLHDYDYDNTSVVPCSADMWLTYPNGPGWINGQLDLTNSNRKQQFGPQTLLSAELSSFAPERRPLLWQARHLPRGEGRIDGRWADWWQYLLDLDDETGRGQPVTRPTIYGPPPITPVPAGDKVMIGNMQTAYFVMVNLTMVDYSLDEQDALEKLKQQRVAAPRDTVVWLDYRQVRIATIQ